MTDPCTMYLGMLVVAVQGLRGTDHGAQDTSIRYHYAAPCRRQLLNCAYWHTPCHSCVPHIWLPWPNAAIAELFGSLTDLGF